MTVNAKNKLFDAFCHPNEDQCSHDVQHQIASKLDSHLSDVELCEFRQVSTFMTLAALAAVAV
jgi:hypothetical protein